MKLSKVVTLFLLLLPLLASGQVERFNRISDNPGGLYGVKSLWNLQWFQGYHKQHSYFEGWYFKMVSADGEHRFAFIPGVSLGKDAHAFVQFIDGQTGKTQYYKFGINDFYYSSTRFAVWVGPNFFSADSFFVDLGKGDKKIIGKGIITNRVEYPVKTFITGYNGMVQVCSIHGVFSWRGKHRS